MAKKYDPVRDPDPRESMRRLINMALIAKDLDPERFGHNLAWYPRGRDTVNDISAEHGWTQRQGVGITAALSPNRDWDENVKAVHDLGRVVDDVDFHKEWQEQVPGQERTQGLSDYLSGTSLKRSTNNDISRALAIHYGRDYEDVLGHPKTHAFAENFWKPTTSDRVTVDGRHADLVADSMRPWQSARGIGGQRLKDGGPPQRYGEYEDITRGAHAALQEADPGTFGPVIPSATQGALWEFAKVLERRGDMSFQGDRRIGQSYEARLDLYKDGNLSRNDHFSIGLAQP